MGSSRADLRPSVGNQQCEEITPQEVIDELNLLGYRKVTLPTVAVNIAIKIRC